MKPHDPGPIDPAERAGSAGSGNGAVPGGAGAAVPEPDPAPETVAMAAVEDVLGQVEQVMRAAVAKLETALRLGAAEKVEGLTPDLALANLARMPYPDRTALLTTADVIGDLPWLRGAWERGEIFWGQVRAICRSVARRSKDQRTWLDARLKATADDHDGLDGYAPDELLTEVEIALAELDDIRKLEQREDRAVDDAKLITLPRLGGGGDFFVHEPDPARFATLLNAFDDAAGAPCPDVPRSKQRADGLQKMAAAWLGGGNGKPAKPLILVRVDIADVVTNTAGRVLLTTRGDNLPTITARTLEALGTDADLRIVIFDGGNPLAVSDVIHAENIPTKTRYAILTRDCGDRFPGSTVPAKQTDTHHDPPISEGGDHRPDHLLLLSRRAHTLRHRYRWQLKVEAKTGEVIARRRGRTFRSLPRGTPLSRPRDGPDVTYHDDDGNPLPF
ncbi:MAG: hypothetical protein KY469_05925 [Actinobacteria bacterium]|nr:hypothetical protein [Actinomycetota bacterium]